MSRGFPRQHTCSLYYTGVCAAVIRRFSTREPFTGVPPKAALCETLSDPFKEMLQIASVHTSYVYNVGICNAYTVHIVWYSVREQYV